MRETPSRPIPFFEDYPRFLETNKTGGSVERLNARYTGLIHRHRHLLKGATVLDMASHDGRFTFSALSAGARRVVGVELDGSLVAESRRNLATYGVPTDRYEFIQADLFRFFDDPHEFDVVLCFGILYHLNDHMMLLSKIAGVNPRWLIVDTHTSRLDGAVIELKSALGASSPSPGASIEGWPTPLALDLMLAFFGWGREQLDWEALGLASAPGMGDYGEGMRVSILVDCGQRVPHDVRQRAVALVQQRTTERSTQWFTILAVAEEFGVKPQILRAWVREAQGRKGAPLEAEDGVANGDGSRPELRGWDSNPEPLG